MSSRSSQSLFHSSPSTVLLRRIKDCIIAADPNRSDYTRFNEIFTARIPYDMIQEENTDKGFEAVKE